MTACSFEESVTVSGRWSLVGVGQGHPRGCIRSESVPTMCSYFPNSQNFGFRGWEMEIEVPYSFFLSGMCDFHKPDTHDIFQTELGYLNPHMTHTGKRRRSRVGSQASSSQVNVILGAMFKFDLD